MWVEKTETSDKRQQRTELQPRDSKTPLHAPKHRRHPAQLDPTSSPHLLPIPSLISTSPPLSYRFPFHQFSHVLTQGWPSLIRCLLSHHERPPLRLMLFFHYRDEYSLFSKVFRFPLSSSTFLFCHVYALRLRSCCPFSSLYISIFVVSPENICIQQ